MTDAQSSGQDRRSGLAIDYCNGGARVGLSNDQAQWVCGSMYVTHRTRKHSVCDCLMRAMCVQRPRRRAPQGGSPSTMTAHGPASQPIRRSTSVAAWTAHTLCEASTAYCSHVSKTKLMTAPPQTQMSPLRPAVPQRVAQRRRRRFRQSSKLQWAARWRRRCCSRRRRRQQSSSSPGAWRLCTILGGKDRQPQEWLWRRRRRVRL